MRPRTRSSPLYKALREAMSEGFSPPLACNTLLEWLVLSGAARDLYFDQPSRRLLVVVSDPAAAVQAETTGLCDERIVRIVLPWREPDAYHPHLKEAVWYGPGGPEGDGATSVSDIGASWFQFTEYQHAEGYLDDYDKDRPFLRSRVSFELRFPRLDAAMALRVAAEIGARRSGEGPHDDDRMVDSLP